ncbi:MAG TPA: arginase family protein [Hypericibacter adhaerens]|jgi:arginase|uniref:Arginase n=1 Tax=Hypericibacter adhaerens TaxID=2602016 RepID=A0A5J6N4L8_9PROT|nr:arginase family protein [Hypericibacter adhaerens]QEX24769.1 arginase [Hypericibacter adhaerens]HWA45376.1 arginase family protein [Hypericibacter adhaerens]
MPRYAIIEAPSPLGLWPSGVERTPEVLQRLGLGRALDARHAGRIEPPGYDPVRDEATRMLNPQGIADYSVSLADIVGEAVDQGEFPIVLGGDCSILLGCMLALRRRDRYGLLFLDGHADFYQPEASLTGEAADMDLALVSGRGPGIVTDIDGGRPYVRDEDIVLFGHRDAEIARQYGSQDVNATDITVLDLPAVRKAGVAASASAAVRRLADGEGRGFWIHLDVDVLDDAVMPAVDYRMEGGLDLEELVTVLRSAVGSGHAVGLDLTIFNPNLDPNRTIARNLVGALVRALR